MFLSLWNNVIFPKTSYSPPKDKEQTVSCFFIHSQPTLNQPSKIGLRPYMAQMGSFYIEFIKRSLHSTPKHWWTKLYRNKFKNNTQKQYIKCQGVERAIDIKISKQLFKKSQFKSQHIKHTQTNTPTENGNSQERNFQHHINSRSSENRTPKISLTKPKWEEQSKVVSDRKSKAEARSGTIQSQQTGDPTVNVNARNSLPN
ncbi:hypothetical protein AVEN_14355-1 [Araneus ventricosus]|uniref:Uncharacterized protein n=1 Tax=Araneus ventricosus TaxID=182803 RepID=A0A4Y2NG45_ARAVE|nr:hypothetical protein AVEN_14355-1 [Araneus ventricosus]